MPPRGGWLTGVYCWVNRVTGKRYVGSSSVSLHGRLKSYRVELRKGGCHNRYLQRAWDKYGAKAFAFQILERCCPEKCIEREQWWMDHFRSYDPRYGYNSCPTAGSVRGLKHSLVSRGRHSARAKKQFASPEARAKASEAAKRRFQDPAQRERLSKALKGVKLTPETRAKMSAAQKARYQDPEERRKTSEHAKKAWADPQIRARMLAANRRKE